MIFKLYKILTIIFMPLIYGLLLLRVWQGKADASRLGEYVGFSGAKMRPNGKLIWVHAASVGEAQASLQLIDDVLDRYADVHIMLTTGTVTSAQLMGQKLPARAFHFFYPLDQAGWVKRFLNYWHPDYIVWLESELWPNMLSEINKRGIGCSLINARLSERSARRWAKIKQSARQMFDPFDFIFAQTQKDIDAFLSLGVPDNKLRLSGNVKYSAKSLSFDLGDFNDFQSVCAVRPIWVYASTHDGEEALACLVHGFLKERFSRDVLTIIVPRHPQRRDDIAKLASEFSVNIKMRGQNKTLPSADTDLYVADTLGELGLFYAATPISVIGRSFSHDGGGGHNPIEAAQLGSAVLSGPNHQYQHEIFKQMVEAGAAHIVASPDMLGEAILSYFNDQDALQKIQDKGRDFVQSKNQILDDIENDLWRVLDLALEKSEGTSCH